MKAASPALVALINSGSFDAWECFTFILKGGGQLLLSTAPFAVKSGPTVWPANGPIALDGDGGSGSRARWTAGLDVDEWTLTLAPRQRDPFTGESYPDKIGDAPFLMGARAGLLDDAEVIIWRAYFDPVTLPAPAKLQIEPVGFMIIFRGLVNDVDLTTSTAIITINDFRQLLSMQMPRNIYQAQCTHTLFDSGCKLSAPSFTVGGKIIATVSRSAFYADPPPPGGSGTFAFGRVTMTSGNNKGLVRSIVGWDGGTGFKVSPPFPFVLAINDTAAFAPGCNKNVATCQAFGNIINYGGDPFIPPPTSTSL